MFFKKKKQEQGYAFRPREYDRDERIELQKIVSSIPVTRKMLSQELLVTATNNFVVKNLKIGSTAAHHINTTKHPQLFFQSYKNLVESTENLQKLLKQRDLKSWQHSLPALLKLRNVTKNVI
jgi:hypothetical protein